MKNCQNFFQWLKIYSVSFVILVILLRNSTVFIFVVKTGSVVHAGVERDIFLPLPAKRWDYRHVSQSPVKPFYSELLLKHWSAYAISTAQIKSFSKTRVRTEE